jgi:hypothetical protein
MGHFVPGVIRRVGSQPDLIKNAHRTHAILMSRALAHVAVHPPAAAGGRSPRRVPRSSRALAPRASAAANDPKLSAASSETRPSPETKDAEAVLLARLRAVSGRGAGASEADERLIADAVTVLETSGGGLRDPASRPEIEGTWRLLYTSKSPFDARNPLGKRVDGTKPGLEGLFATLFGDEAAKTMADGFPTAGSGLASASSSPIQRTVTSLEAFTIQQAIRLFDKQTGAPRKRAAGQDADARVDQIVQFGNGNFLRLSAKANVVDRPSRRSKDASDDKSSHSISRIDFAFDLAYFELATGPFGIKLPGTRPARVPYPVPFSLLGDEVKGWLETSYLGKDVRISRGNKGTTFILVREAEEANGGAPLPYEF